MLYTDVVICLCKNCCCTNLHLFVCRKKSTLERWKWYRFLIFFRDHPSTVKKRFFSVFIVMLISPLFIYFFISRNNLSSITIWEIMGFRTQGFLMAFFVPLVLTVILFLGPLSVQIHNEVWKSCSGMLRVLIL